MYGMLCNGWNRRTFVPWDGTVGLLFPGVTWLMQRKKRQKPTMPTMALVTIKQLTHDKCKCHIQGKMVWLLLKQQTN
jgi:hypothetical protein